MQDSPQCSHNLCEGWDAMVVARVNYTFSESMRKNYLKSECRSSASLGHPSLRVSSC